MHGPPPLAVRAPATGELPFVRRPKQERSRKTAERILAAASALLDDRSFDGLTIADVVARAGSSSGSFYARFSDKRALLYALHERWRWQMLEAIDEVLERKRPSGSSIVDVVSEAVTLFVRLFRSHHGLLRAVLMEAVHVQDLADRAQTVADELSGRLHSLVLERRHELADPAAGDSAIFAFRMVLGALNQTLFFPADPSSLVPVAEDNLAARLSSAYLCLIGVQAPNAAHRRVP